MADSRTHNVHILATMWQRIPPPYSTEVGGRVPMSYSLLVMPAEALLRAEGVTDDRSIWGEHRDHPYAKWTSYSLAKGTKLETALVAIEKKNQDTPRLAKIRICFVDGLVLTLARSNVSDPNSLQAVGTYDPSHIYESETEVRRCASRLSYTQKNKFLADSAGHIITGVSTEGSLSAAKLFRDVPPPDHSKPGYDFTPMSHIAFLARPNCKIAGVKPGLSSTNGTAVQYRPRAFLRPQNDHPSRHSSCAEVCHIGNTVVDLSATVSSIDNRNRLSPVRQRPEEKSPLKPHE